MPRGKIDWAQINQLGTTQAAGAVQVTQARPYMPAAASYALPGTVPTAPPSGGLNINPIGALAGAAIGFAVASGAGWPPMVGAGLGGLAGGVLIG